MSSSDNLTTTAPECPTALIVKRPKPPPKWIPLALAIWFWEHVRRVVVFVIGMTIVGIGVAMLVLPGPGWLTIFGGLALLATEFAWARWMLKYAKTRLLQLVDYARGSPGANPATSCETEVRVIDERR